MRILSYLGLQLGDLLAQRINLGLKVLLFQSKSLRFSFRGFFFRNALRQDPLKARQLAVYYEICTRCCFQGFLAFFQFGFRNGVLPKHDWTRWVASSGTNVPKGISRTWKWKTFQFPCFLIKLKACICRKTWIFFNFYKWKPRAVTFEVFDNFRKSNFMTFWCSFSIKKDTSRGQYFKNSSEISK